MIRYSYLWQAEYRQGREEGVKDRPCAVVLSVTRDDGSDVVTVLPITHSQPASLELAVELPGATKSRLGLDHERSWVVLTEANRFVWPGPDLRPSRGNDEASVAFGLLPLALAQEIRLKFTALIKARRAGVVPRPE